MLPPPSSLYSNPPSDVVATLLFSKAIAINCSCGHIAILTTRDARPSPTYHLRVRSPVYSS